MGSSISDSRPRLRGFPAQICMPAEARITPVWTKQKLLAALFPLGFSVFFFWDGAVGYPSADHRYHEWKQYHDEGKLSEWPEIAKQKGWKSNEWDAWLNDPHQQGRVPEFRWGHGKYTEQFVCGSFAFTVGLIVLTYWLSQKNRVVRTDEEAVYSPDGTRVPFTAITGVGKKKWEDKGYATILYKIDGRKGRFLLDDYKFDREATHQILAEIEAKVLARAEA